MKDDLRPSSCRPGALSAVSDFWDLHATRVIVGGGVALGLLTGLTLWHRDSSHGTGGIGPFLFDVVVIGLILCAPLAMLALALTDRVVAFLGGLFVILVGNLLYWISFKRNGSAAKAGDAKALAKVDRWKRWQKKWMR